MFCLKRVTPLEKVFHLVNGDMKPTMGYIYEVMDKTKEKIANNFNGIKRRYRQTRWDSQLHKPLHTKAYYLYPQYGF